MRYLPSIRRFLKAVTVLLSMAMITPTLPAAEDVKNEQAPLTAEEERLVQRIKEAVMDELMNGPALQEQIELGIRRFVEEQRAAARAQQQQTASERVRNMRPVTPARDHVYGNADAVISLVEYSDFECPYCKRFHATARAAVDESGGKLNWVYRHYPLSMHDPGATREAIASECANEQGGNEAFWSYADAIFERTTSNGNGFPASGLAPLARELGLDQGKFEECLESERYAARVGEDLRDGTAIGITGTPGNVLVNHETGEIRVIPGAVPLQVLKSQYEELLE